MYRRNALPSVGHLLNSPPARSQRQIRFLLCSASSTGPAASTLCWTLIGKHSRQREGTAPML
ncbi:hypothetical protein LX32DRAFT_636783, partial [Colletotrichum zoysiae]